MKSMAYEPAAFEQLENRLLLQAVPLDYLASSPGMTAGLQVYDALDPVVSGSVLYEAPYGSVKFADNGALVPAGWKLWFLDIGNQPVGFDAVLNGQYNYYSPRHKLVFGDKPTTPGTDEGATLNTPISVVAQSPDNHFFEAYTTTDPWIFTNKQSTFNRPIRVTSNEVQFLMGDINGDNTVDVRDLGVLGAHYGQTGNVYWCDGNFNFDGVIDVRDLGVLGAHYGQTINQYLAEQQAGGAASAPTTASSGKTLSSDVAVASYAPVTKSVKASLVADPRVDVLAMTPNLDYKMGLLGDASPIAKGVFRTVYNDIKRPAATSDLLDLERDLAA